MKTPPASVWHLVIEDPYDLVPHWHPREATYIEEWQARAHAEQAERLGGDVTVYVTVPEWTVMP